MSKVKSKGTLLQLEVATVMTTIAQCEKIDGPDPEVQDVETPTLDQSGAAIPHDETGYVEPGTVDFDIYWDSALAIHQELTDRIAAPSNDNWNLVLANSDELPFPGILKKLTPSFETGNYVKASCSIQCSDLATYPT